MPTELELKKRKAFEDDLNALRFAHDVAFDMTGQPCYVMHNKGNQTSEYYIHFSLRTEDNNDQ